MSDLIPGTVRKDGRILQEYGQLHYGPPGPHREDFILRHWIQALEEDDLEIVPGTAVIREDSGDPDPYLFAVYALGWSIR